MRRSHIVLPVAVALAALPAAVAASQAPHAKASGPALTSTTIDLPVDRQAFPAGPGAAVTQRVCTVCHSPAMILTQPPLTSEQWTAEIRKMADVYKARITPDEAERIHAYLVGLTPEPPAPR